MTEAGLHGLLARPGNAVRRYETGDFIAMPGDVCRALYVLAVGSVRAQMVSAEGKQLTVDHLQAPELLAPAFLFSSENRFPVNIEALEACEVVAVDCVNLLSAMQGDAVLMQNFLRVMSDRSLFLSRKLNEFALQGLKERLLNFLRLHDTISNQQEVAYILGVARPSLARALSELVAEGKVVVRGKREGRGVCAVNAMSRPVSKTSRLIGFCSCQNPLGRASNWYINVSAMRRCPSAFGCRRSVSLSWK